MALRAELDALAALGVNAIELMPVAEFPGERNWGYDGVDLFAPVARLRRPGRAEAARRRGAPRAGSVSSSTSSTTTSARTATTCAQFARDYFTDRHETPWGDAINFDGPNSAMVRALRASTTRCYWLRRVPHRRPPHRRRVHPSTTIPRHILAELTATARRAAPTDIVMIAETYENDVPLLCGRDERRPRLRRRVGGRLPPRRPRASRATSTAATTQDYAERSTSSPARSTGAGYSKASSRSTSASARD